MHILVVNDDGPPSPHSSPYVHSLARELQAAGHVVSVILPHVQRSWIGKAHQIGQTVRPSYYRPPPISAPPAGLGPASDHSSAGLDSQDRGHGSVHTRPWKQQQQQKPDSTANDEGHVEEWVLVDGTPASCVQIGLYHFFQDRGPVDLVVSGPNYGRNTTAAFALSSGTLGAALEAAVCRRRAIALSYAFFSRNHDPVVVAAATRRSVRVIETLAKQWPADGSVDLYSVNVPLVPEVEKGKVLFTYVLQNYWGEGSSCFEAVDGSDDEGEEEERIREGEGDGLDLAERTPAGHTHKHFKWAPRFSDVYKSVDDAPPGNDGWAVKEGYTSVTPLKANFWHASTHQHGQELILESQAAFVAPARNSPPKKVGLELAVFRPPKTPSSGRNEHFYAIISYEDDYVQPLLLSAMQSLFPANTWTSISPLNKGASLDNTNQQDSLALGDLVPQNDGKIVQITAYEAIDFAYAKEHPEKCLVNSYMIRKALIRKHFLSATVENWVAKHPSSVLATHVKRSEAFELDYAEFLDDALIEAFDLRASLERNDDTSPSHPLAPEQREWWILKPGMSDRGQGIRLFSTMDELQAIFDDWEVDVSDTEEGDEEASQENWGNDMHIQANPGAVVAEGIAEGQVGKEGYITTSHLRHFVVQPYIHQPLLSHGDPRKFHIRTYVLALGSLRVYVYREMLALFAAQPYVAPWEDSNLDVHLTNTCLQSDGKADAVRRFWDLALDHDLRVSIFGQICDITGEVFEAAARGTAVHFQPLPNAFEVFGLDFLADAAGNVWLLEVNAFPDFRQTGDGLRDVVAGFWQGVLRLAVGPFVGLEADRSRLQLVGKSGEIGEAARQEEDDMLLVRSVDLGQRWKAS